MSNLSNTGIKDYTEHNLITKSINAPIIPLSYREKKVLEFAAHGLDNPEIAKKLYISRHTVKAHLASAFRKLSAANRTNAVYLALIKKIID